MSKPDKKLLRVEDDSGLQSQLRWSFDGYDVLTAGDRDSALKLMGEHGPPVVTLDLGLPPDAEGVSEGLATLEQIMTRFPHTKVIMVTGSEDRETAVRAIATGAYDFYQKPVDVQELGLIIERAFHVHELEEDNRALARQREGSPLEGILGASPEILEVCRMIERVAPTDVTVLLLGDSGTGKELFARALHRLSGRRDGPFVAINCAAIPETLLESELFGYEKGAFTGAVKQTKGKIEKANKGTLFLDEIGDLPQSLQAKLLRFFQERTIDRLGGGLEIEVDVRIVCATHQDLKALVDSGDFREDLYYRISEMSIEVPPLRERSGDCMLLARAFLDRYNKQLDRKVNGFTPEAVLAMEAYRWPGNVRELENKIKRAIILEDGRKISPDALELPVPREGESTSINLKEAREQLERQLTQRALSMCGGNISRAAEALGVSRPTLYAILEKYGLKLK